MDRDGGLGRRGCIFGVTINEVVNLKFSLSIGFELLRIEINCIRFYAAIKVSTLTIVSSFK
jgi:hypothetical protein